VLYDNRSDIICNLFVIIRFLFLVTIGRRGGGFAFLGLHLCGGGNLPPVAYG
jgi:hypothetical protein